MIAADRRTLCPDCCLSENTRKLSKLHLTAIFMFGVTAEEMSMCAQMSPKRVSGTKSSNRAAENFVVIYALFKKVDFCVNTSDIEAECVYEGDAVPEQTV
ncbi:hypothetical protein XENORESO_003040 [Xenotaenia resolanae]|uniref:Uncharacterized protein n=1 Tax=Xenotaenia resolanae TaxID=208358 RepID=A0ABV0WHV8_9TELE